MEGEILLHYPLESPRLCHKQLLSMRESLAVLLGVGDTKVMLLLLFAGFMICKAITRRSDFQPDFVLQHPYMLPMATKLEQCKQ